MRPAEDAERCRHGHVSGNDAGLTPYFEGTHWTFPAPPELIQAAQAGYADLNTYPRRWPTQLRLYRRVRSRTRLRRTLMAARPTVYMFRLTCQSSNTGRSGLRPRDVALIKMNRASRASNASEVQKNSDNSVDLFVGAKAPAGKESNWIPTDPKREFELMVRLYGPTKAFFDKQWTLSDAEEVK